ncbi:hypothetical protein HZH68_003811 [Vespula germanica]|uniref:Uncharacterized protein n=1 Tax=Vespula germanica TaxID=30212 RepID=A0A834NHM5_VESGE|nr:hypothetical protein HZH68_003811 [Vespula germanica]
MRDERRFRWTLRRLEALPLARRAPLASLNTKCITHLLENPAGGVSRPYSGHIAFGKDLKSFRGPPANDNVISLNRTFRVNVQNSIISDEGIETSRTKQLTLDAGTTIEVANLRRNKEEEGVGVQGRVERGRGVEAEGEGGEFEGVQNKPRELAVITALWAPEYLSSFPAVEEDDREI